jgi:hypothetical protein
MQQALGPSSIREYRPLIEAETMSFMRRLLDDPIDYINLTRRYAAHLLRTTCISIFMRCLISPIIDMLVD